MYKKYTKKSGMAHALCRKLWLIMRLTTVILIASLLQVSASGFGQRVTISQKNSTLQRILQEIRKQSGYNLFYDARILPKDQKVSVAVKNVTVEEALDSAVKGLPLIYEIIDQSILIKKMEKTSLFENLVKSFREINVRGKVLDEKGQPLVGATVTIKGKNRSVKTDQNGAFYLESVDEHDKLVISYIGYQNREVDATSDMGTLTMTLANAKLEEVIVNTGYYTVKDTERTGSIARITAKDIEKQSVTNVIAAMQGRMAGVNIVQTSGIPGGAFNIEIRGRNSIREDGNTPLYIIDGMPYPTKKLESLTGSLYLQNLNPMDGINPADIESVEVLKDADATSIYGSRGANGVVLISTKKGKAGKTEFSLNAYTGVGKVVQRLEFMNTPEYLQMRKEAFANDGLSSSSLEYENAYDINGTWDENRYTDWQKEMIGGTSAMSNIQFGVSGGSMQTQFLMSAAHSKETTVFPGDFGYKKSSAHLTLSHNSVDGKFSASFSGNYVVTRNDQPYTDLTRQGLLLAPNAPALFKENGELNWEPGFENPLASLQSTYLSKNNTFTTGGTVGYILLPGLQIKSAFGFVDGRLAESRTTPHTASNPSFGYDSSFSSHTLNTGSKQSWNIEPQISWLKQFGKGQLNILVGTTFQQSESSILYATGYNFTSNSLIKNLGAAKTVQIFSEDTDYRYNALFFRFNYSLNEKYILNITARRDGSSRFGPGKRFGNFGAIGMAWLFGKEKFVVDHVPFLSFGKLRSSYGTSGSDQIGDYQFLDTYSTGSQNYQGVVGLRPTRLFNPDFSWEANRKLEVAVDLGFLEDKIFFTTAYFRNRSSNQLVGMPLPGITGFTTLQTNLDATVQNTGLEFELKTTNINSVAFNWTTTMNATIPRNKLISFADFESSVYAQDYVMGESLNIRKLYNYTGVDPQTGIYTFKDYNGDGKLSYDQDGKKLIDLGSGFFGGIANHISYKGFELDFVLHLEKRRGADSNGGWSNIAGNGGSQPINALMRWQKEGDITNVQRYTAGYEGKALDAAYRYFSSDATYIDASFIRLKTFSFAYNLKKSWLKAANCRFYLQGQNLFTITNYKGLDPESQWIYSLPPLRVFTVGIKFNY